MTGADRFDLAPSRDFLADAADRALNNLAQEVPHGQQFDLVSTFRPIIRGLRNGGTDWDRALTLLDMLAPGEMGLPLRRAIIACSVSEAQP